MCKSHIIFFSEMYALSSKGANPYKITAKHQTILYHTKSAYKAQISATPGLKYSLAKCEAVDPRPLKSKKIS